MYTEIHRCRICGNSHLTTLLDLGSQALTGVFPKKKDMEVESMPIVLTKCTGEDVCGLVQLKHSGAPEEMYGMNYGYRSGINQSMVKHLKGVQEQAIRMGEPKNGDIILDIGSNDATFLSFYEPNAFTLIGMDPTGVKFESYYPPHISLVKNFFSAERFQRASGNRPAKIITSIAMFYDLESPQSFVNDIAESLADDGIWIFEQSYLPSMLAVNAYDTICHEHLEYYALRQIVWLLERAGMGILDVSLNDANGGSFRVTAVKESHPKFSGHAESAKELLQREANEGMEDLATYEAFSTQVFTHRKNLNDLLKKLHGEGKTVFGLGASTKGNVILQFCNLTVEDVPCIAEVNEDKFGCFTPGTKIPILSQREADIKRPDYYLVMPWHFKNGIVKGMAVYLQNGGKLIFPLPELSIIDHHSSVHREHASAA
ncbi:MAG TPA: class I SAM-dependent methyltransferase [Candidatus Peribacterales bacterium]|nr:class I SAM-dependent methyltransferase [Candidatus Peribacterales bacterium]